MKHHFYFHYILSIPLQSSVAEAHLYFTHFPINSMVLQCLSHQKNTEYLTKLINGSIPSFCSAEDEARDLLLVVKDISSWKACVNVYNFYAQAIGGTLWLTLSFRISRGLIHSSWQPITLAPNTHTHTHKYHHSSWASCTVVKYEEYSKISWSIYTMKKLCPYFKNKFTPK